MSNIERFLQTKGAVIVNGGDRWFVGIVKDEGDDGSADSYYIDMSLDEGTWADSAEEAVRLTEEAVREHALAMAAYRKAEAL